MNKKSNTWSIGRIQDYMDWMDSRKVKTITVSSSDFRSLLKKCLSLHGNERPAVHLGETLQCSARGASIPLGGIGVSPQQLESVARTLERLAKCAAAIEK